MRFEIGAVFWCMFYSSYGFKDPDTERGTIELIESRKFESETHHVKTSDNYVLTLHRIVNPLVSKRKLKVVILQHGLLSSSRDFVVNSPSGNLGPNETVDICSAEINPHRVGNNLGFVLSKMGFDVWMPNSRGNVYSQNHTVYTPKDRKFWDFTFDHMVRYDVPAYLEYILKKTGQKTVSYIGHSEGGFTMLGALSIFPEFSDIVKPYIGLAPVYTLRGVRSFFGLSKDLPYFSATLLRMLRGPLIPSPWLNSYLERSCRGIETVLCEEVLFESVGFDFKQANSSRLPVYLSHFPSQTSKWNLAHYAQLLTSQTKEMKMFDYGFFGNLRRYGQVKPHPRNYLLNRIKSKYLILMNAKNDWLVTPEAMDLLKKSLTVKLLDDYVVPDDDWNHIDFLLARQAGFYVNSKILQALQRVLC